MGDIIQKKKTGGSLQKCQCHEIQRKTVTGPDERTIKGQDNLTQCIILDFLLLQRTLLELLAKSEKNLDSK